MLRDNLEVVEKRILAACSRANRKRGSVELIAVSKTKPVGMIQEVYDCGVRDFGENYPQELRDKMPQFGSDLRWHMIGPLQKNKIKYVIGKVCLIHSVDSLALAEALSKAAIKAGVVQKVLIEVNIASEESKHGFSGGETEQFIREAAVLPGISIEGLMTIAPFVEDPEENRVHFRAMRELEVDIAAKNIDNVSMRHLSMGMTNDYEVAIEEGATMIRVGTGIFGERNYQK